MCSAVFSAAALQHCYSTGVVVSQCCAKCCFGPSSRHCPVTPPQRGHQPQRCPYHITYGPSLILSNFGSQTFRKQFCGALKQQKQMALWGDPKSKITRFLYLVYKSNFFAYIIRMSLWRSGSMQLQHAKGPQVKSWSSKFFTFF